MKDISKQSKSYNEQRTEYRKLLVDGIREFILKYGKKEDDRTAIIFDYCGVFNLPTVFVETNRRFDEYGFEDIQGMSVNNNDNSFYVSTECCDYLDAISIDTGTLEDIYDELYDVDTDEKLRSSFIIEDGVISEKDEE